MVQSSPGTACPEEQSAERRALVGEIIESGEDERQRLWEEALPELEAVVGKIPFQMFLARSRLVGWTGGSFTVAVGSKFGAETALRSHAGAIAEVLARLTGRKRAVQVYFVVDEALCAAEPEPVDGAMFVVEVQRPRNQPPVNLGRIENNLARKGVFTLSGKNPAVAGTVSTMDLLGAVSREFTIGELGEREMDILLFLLGRWTPENKGHIHFTFRELQRSLGIKWSGKLPRDFRDAIRRMSDMKIRGRMFDGMTKRYGEHSFHILDYVLHEKREHIDDEESGGGSAQMLVILSDFMRGQMEHGQYADLDLDQYRNPEMARFPKCRRLYLLLESNDGEHDGTLVRLPVGDALGQTLGTNDARANSTRFRRDLMMYGELICRATGGLYRRFRLVAGPGGVGWVLEVERSAEWLPRRIAQRKMFNERFGRQIAETRRALPAAARA